MATRTTCFKTRRPALCFLSISARELPWLIIGSEWKVSGAGDFNRDRENDLVIENTTTRATQIVYLNGATQTALANGPTLLSGWTVAGVADVNNDAKPDYILSKPSTRQTAF